MLARLVAGVGRACSLPPLTFFLMWAAAIVALAYPLIIFLVFEIKEAVERVIEGEDDETAAPPPKPLPACLRFTTLEDYLKRDREEIERCLQVLEREAEENARFIEELERERIRERVEYQEAILDLVDQPGISRPVLLNLL